MNWNRFYTFIQHKEKLYYIICNNRGWRLCYGWLVLWSLVSIVLLLNLKDTLKRQFVLSTFSKLSCLVYQNRLEVTQYKFSTFLFDWKLNWKKTVLLTISGMESSTEIQSVTLIFTLSHFNWPSSLLIVVLWSSPHEIWKVERCWLIYFLSILYISVF